jgi:signal transduction histidine kinase
LVRAVRALAREMEHNGIHVDVSAIGWPSNLPRVVALSLYRVAQEALHNATKHSGSDHVSVDFRQDNDSLSLSISDYGVGFTPRGNGAFAGLGIVSMRQRLRSSGGSLTITSAPEDGTCVRARLPRQVRLSRFNDLFDLKEDSSSSYQPAETTL